MEKSTFTREYATVIRLLKQARLKAGITQVALADAIGETQSYVSKVERGELRLDIIQLRTICAVVGTTLSDFVLLLDRELSKRK